jgi:hypothetical protein
LQASVEISAMTRATCRLITRRTLVLFGIVLVGTVSAWTQQGSYVLKSGDGERLPGDEWNRVSQKYGTVHKTLQ